MKASVTVINDILNRYITRYNVYKLIPINIIILSHRKMSEPIT